jgi:hypothetical protein
LFTEASPVQDTIGILSGMTKPDPALAKIAAQFARHDVEWSRGAYMIIDRRTANPIARLRPSRTPIASSFSIGQTSKGVGPHSETSVA